MFVTPKEIINQISYLNLISYSIFSLYKQYAHAFYSQQQGSYINIQISLIHKKLRQLTMLQDALNRVGSIFFMECNVRLLTGNLKNVINMAKVNGIVVWQSKYPTSAVTHPKMFGYFKASEENFYFVPAVEPSRLILFNTKAIHYSIMLPWIKCVLVRSCILPIGKAFIFKKKGKLL